MVANETKEYMLPFRPVKDLNVKWLNITPRDLDLFTCIFAQDENRFHYESAKTRQIISCDYITSFIFANMNLIPQRRYNIDFNTFNMALNPEIYGISDIGLIKKEDKRLKFTDVYGDKRNTKLLMPRADSITISSSCDLNETEYEPLAKSHINPVILGLMKRQFFPDSKIPLEDVLLFNDMTRIGQGLDDEILIKEGLKKSTANISKMYLSSAFTLYDVDRNPKGGFGGIFYRPVVKKIYKGDKLDHALVTMVMDVYDGSGNKTSRLEKKTKVTKIMDDPENELLDELELREDPQYHLF